MRSKTTPHRLSVARVVEVISEKPKLDDYNATGQFYASDSIITIVISIIDSSDVGL